MIDLSEFEALLDDSPFEEVPVDLDTFIRVGAGYLVGDKESDRFELSPIQRDLVESMSQIYKLEDVQRIHGVEAGIQHFKRYTKKEVIMQLGKGSGKDFTSTVGCAYLVYKLLCLKDPSKYFGKVSGDAIDIINIAINAQQARTVFFKGFKSRINRSPWFRGRYNEKSDSIEFDKAVTVYSGHSERESHEGLNLILAILDEISGFAMTSDSGNMNAKTGQAIYDAFRGSVDSRFPDYGKVVLLSFPRYKGDFISSHYDKMVVEKDVIEREHTFVIDPELAATEDNIFKIRWEEDVIKRYFLPGKVFAIKAPSWEVNPGRSIEDYKDSFLQNPNDAYQRFACMPSGLEDGLFRDEQALKDLMIVRNPIDTSRRLEESWTPKEDVKYFFHADLAQKQDRAAVACAHVDRWVHMGKVDGHDWIAPVVVVDFVCWWTPEKNMPIDLTDVGNWIVGLKRRSIPIGIVTTDRWNSLDFQNQLKSVNIKTDTLSVARKEYDDLQMAVYDGRVLMPNIELLLTELMQLRIINDKKVDHPRSGCFIGDTRVPLLDGTYPQMSELVGRQVWVYSSTPDGKIVPGLARGRMTKHTDELVDVILDNGYVARCTPEHLWMLRDGSYKEAQHLVPGVDRLMPITINWPVNGGYIRVTDKDGVRTLGHHLGQNVPDGYVVHHINENKTDNRPENLAVVSHLDHVTMHAREAWAQRVGGMRAGYQKWAVDEQRKADVYRNRSLPFVRADVSVDSILESIRNGAETRADVARSLNCDWGTVDKKLKREGVSFDDLVKMCDNNHKVRAVIPVKLDEPVPVYDLEVDDYHNFALSGGVFVHNSKDLADAVAGAVHNAVAYTPRFENTVVEARDITTLRRTEKQVAIEKPELPSDIEDWLRRMKAI